MTRSLTALKLVIYITAMSNMAAGTGGLMTDTFGFGFSGWREAVVSVVCIEALLVYCVAQARITRATKFRVVAAALLSVSALLQVASVVRSIGADDVSRLALAVIVSCASVAALAVIVFGVELAETPAKQTETGAQHVHIHTDNLTLSAQQAQSLAQTAQESRSEAQSVDALAPPEAPQIAKFCERVGCNKPAIGTRKYCSDSCRAQHSTATRRNRIAQEVKS